MVDPDIVIVVNGGPPESEKPATHFCATRSRLLNPKVPCIQDKVRLFDSFEFAKKIGENWKEERLKRTIFARLRGINFEIDGLEEQMQDMAKKMKEAKKKRDVFESDLVELGFNVESLRGLRKNRSKESYDPVGDKAEATPEYVRTPKEKEQKPQEQQQEQHKRVEEEVSEKEKQKDEELMLVDLTDPESTAKLLNIPVEEKREVLSMRIVEQLGMDPETFRKFV